MGRLSVHVAPGAARTELVGRHGDGWKARVAAAPRLGRANAALVELLADVLGVRRADVEVVAGHAGRRKTVEVAGLGEAEIEKRLEQLLR
jgi:uncharacterized protein (TIGR00251 family)